MALEASTVLLLSTVPATAHLTKNNTEEGEAVGHLCNAVA
jgi:hypothetical protein